MSERWKTLTAVGLALAAGALLTYLILTQFDGMRGETPIVIGEGASIEIKSAAAPFSGWSYPDTASQPSNDNSTVWVHPNTGGRVHWVEFRLGTQTRRANWPANGRLVVTYGRTTAGNDVTLIVAALNGAGNGLVIIQADLPLREFRDGLGQTVRTSRATQNVGSVKSVRLYAGTTTTDLCGVPGAPACAGGAATVMLR